MQFISFESNALLLSVPVLETINNDYYYIPNLHCFVLFYSIFYEAERVTCNHYTNIAPLIFKAASCSVMFVLE